MSPHLGSSACPCVTPGPSFAFFSINDAEKVNGTIGTASCHLLTCV